MLERHEPTDEAIVPSIRRRPPIETADEILLVEDNPADIELAIRALRKAGVTNPVRTALDGAEALEALFGARSATNGTSFFRPVVILLDLKLPKVGGLDVLDETKRNEATRSIPVIVLTSSREASDITEAYRRGANSYVVKPVGFEEFTAAIAQIALYWMILNERPL